MIFNSFLFLWLFPIIFVFYQGIQFLVGKKRSNPIIPNCVLQLISYGLYLKWNIWFGLILLGVTLDSYICALLVWNYHGKIKRIILFLALGIGLIPLIFFKYGNFIVDWINSVLYMFDVKVDNSFNWLVPVGISFYTFQSLGYLIDVYKGRIEPERNIVNYCVFVSFFPQILSGPISRASELLPQIRTKRSFDSSKLIKGFKFFLWGLFLKVVVADRIGLYVDLVYSQYSYMSGLTCFISCVLYSFQIYSDFAGYSLMALGTGYFMGFELINNFKRPYLAFSITDFWKRWHISLTRWFTTYLYIELGGNRCNKVRHYLNILATFLVSGIWHGANWTFIAWGAIHGILQCVEKFLGLDSKANNSQSRSIKILTILRSSLTFLLVSFAWILFRSPSFGVAGTVLTKIITFEGEGLYIPNNSTIGFIILGVSLMIIHDCLMEFCPSKSFFYHKSIIVRWIGYISTISIILLCGVFDSSQFIYVKF